MKKFNLRTFLVVLVLTLTMVMFAWYLAKHPEYIEELSRTNFWSVAWIIVVNIALIGTLAGVYHVTVQIAGKRLQPQENLLLTIYSSIANFFGPLQSGPGVRAVYLKKKHAVRLRDYTFATLIYYAVFAMINVFFMIIGTRPWWQAVLAVCAAAGTSYLFIRWYRYRDTSSQESKFRLTPRLLAALIVLTLLQVSLIVGRYYIELHATQTPVSVGQAVSYTGSANMALFASVTPDGIGIREAFLLFTQKLHGVSTQSIISASLLDRASYILFLTLLFLFALATHARDRLKLRQ